MSNVDKNNSTDPKKKPLSKSNRIGYMLIIVGCLIGLLKYQYEDPMRRNIELVECGFLIAGGIVVFIGFSKRRKELKKDAS
jgi:hypothetical protein